MKCTLIVKDNAVLVCIVGTWPKLFTYADRAAAVSVANMIEDTKDTTVVYIPTNTLEFQLGKWKHRSEYRFRIMCRCQRSHITFHYYIIQYI